MSTRSLLLGALPAVLTLTLAANEGCSSGGSSTGEGAAASTSTPLGLNDDELRTMVTKKTTCPFVGTMLALRKIDVFGTKDRPFARIQGEGSIAAAAETIGAGTLSIGFLAIATANHHQAPDGTEAPSGMFSLDFPASLGAHAAHSFILMGDPKTPGSGRMDPKNLDRLVAEKPLGHAERTLDGRLVVRRSELGRFVAQSVHCDPNSRVDLEQVAAFVADHAIALTEAGFDAALETFAEPSSSEAEDATRRMMSNLVQIAVSNSLVASAAEFGLLTMMLEPSASTAVWDGDDDPLHDEPALAVEDIRKLYAGNGSDPLTKGFPSNAKWLGAQKTPVDFVRNLAFILKSAVLSHLGDEFAGDTNCPNMK